MKLVSAKNTIALFYYLMSVDSNVTEVELQKLDDIGAQGLVMDVWLEAVCVEDASFESILAHMERYTLKIMQNNPMRTEEGRRIWEEKKSLTEAFVEAYREDLRR